MRILPQQVDWLELEGFTTTVMNAETVQGKSQIAARREVVQNLPTSEQLMSIIVTAPPLGGGGGGGVGLRFRSPLLRLGFFPANNKVIFGHSSCCPLN